MRNKRITGVTFHPEETTAVQAARRMLLRGDWNSVQREEIDRVVPILNQVLTKMEDATKEGGK